MLDQELVAETIQDIQECKDKILQRHEGDTTFTLRIDTVFNQLINSLGNTTGNIVAAQSVSSGFTPSPLKSVAGAKINLASTETLKLVPLEIDQKEAFKNEIQAIHDSFVSRENGKLLEELKEIQMRGVAKVAGVEGYDVDPINGEFIQKIKDKIVANEKDKLDREKAKIDLQKGSDAGKTATGKGAKGDNTTK